MSYSDGITFGIIIVIIIVIIVILYFRSNYQYKEDRSVYQVPSSKSRNIDLVEIIPGLYIGNKYAVQYMQQNFTNLKAVLNVADEIEDNIFKSDVAYLHLPISETDMDTSLLCSYLREGIGFIDQYLNSSIDPVVLVHCLAGINRSPTVVIAYLMWTRHLTFQQAKSFVKERKRNIHPSHYLQEKTQICFDRNDVY